MSRSIYIFLFLLCIVWVLSVAFPCVCVCVCVESLLHYFRESITYTGLFCISSTFLPTLQVFFFYMWGEAVVDRPFILNFFKLCSSFNPTFSQPSCFIGAISYTVSPKTLNRILFLFSSLLRLPMFALEFLILFFMPVVSLNFGHPWLSVHIDIWPVK